MAEKKEELPDLEEIAKKLTSMDEDLKLGEIEPRVTEAYISIAKYEDEKGRVRYKHDFSDDPEKVKELSDTIFDAISEHIHYLEFDMTPDQYGGLKDFKNASGKNYTDMHAQSALGLSREDLRKRLEKMKKKLTLQSILDLVNGQLADNYIKIKSKEITEGLDETHTEHIKKYIITMADKHKVPQYKDDIKDKTTFEEVIPIYNDFVKNVYKKTLTKE